MSNQNNSISNLISLDKNISHLKCTLWIKISCRFISNNKVWRMNNCSCHCDFLFFSSAEFFDIFNFNTWEIKEIFDRFILFLDHCKWSFLKEQWVNNIFLRRETLNQLIILKNNSDFSSISLDLTLTKYCKIFHFIKNSIFMRSKLSNQKLYESWFPTSRFPCNNEKIPLFKLKIELFEKLSFTLRISPSKIFDINEWNICFICYLHELVI